MRGKHTLFRSIFQGLGSPPCVRGTRSTASKAKKIGKDEKAMKRKRTKKDKRLEKLKSVAAYVSVITSIISGVHASITKGPDIVRLAIKLLKALYQLAS